MKILIDTHALLWAVTDDGRLTAAAKQVYLDTENELYFNAVSFWEICVKVSLGKLSLCEGWSGMTFSTGRDGGLRNAIIEHELDENGIQWLPIGMEHCLRLVKLPFHHPDPFDRMLLSQAAVEDLDAFIAAVALVNGHSIVTANERHFAEIPALEVVVY
jgi:PIN domain nuclease of toxin-antitoxin system